jgi:hypothetical protein
MLIGHYGPSLATKAARNSIPLWVLFIAVQLLDVLLELLCAPWYRKGPHRSRNYGHQSARPLLHAIPTAW